jgi:dephospho-CoA kinase
MILVGLTGGIGSGKSYVAKIFQELSVPVYNADLGARNISNNNPNVRQKIIDLFGDKAYAGDKLDRSYIAGIVFDNPDKLVLLNNIIHPEVQIDFTNWLSVNSGKAYVIKEAAILFESDTYKKLDYNILVTAPEEVKISRIIERDRMNENQVKMRMSRQWNDEDKIPYADFIINNDGDHLIVPQVLDIHNKLIALR